MTTTFAERARGALIGLAAGDALGTTIEFKSPGSFEPVTEIVGGGPFRLEAGEWTDDTSLALCLAASLVEKGGFDPRDQMERYARREDGYMASNGRCFDIGITTGDALYRFQETGEPFAGSTSSTAAGNGSIMRLAPVPIAFYREPQKAVALAGESSRTTHGAATCVDACRYFGGLIVGALAGVAKPELLAANFAPWGTPLQAGELVEEIAEVAAGSFMHRQPPEIVGSGYVVRSLEAALWAFANSDSFEAGALMAVNLGDDADTTGAVYGQLAGAYYGEQAIPQRWRNVLARYDDISSLANGLVALAS